MPAVRTTLRLDAQPRSVAGVLRDVRFATAALAGAGHTISAPGRLLVVGDRVRVGARVAPGLRIPVHTVVDAVSATRVRSSLVSGPLRALVHDTALIGDGPTTRLRDELRWSAPGGGLTDRLLVQRLMAGLLDARSTELVRRLAALDGQPVVVAAAIVRDGRVLAAQRTRPAALAGRWELPGGRVEPGEGEAAAVTREIREELGVTVHATGRIGTDLPLERGVLRVHAARPAAGPFEPAALEHAALHWAGRDDLDALEWVDADRAVLPELRALLDACR